MTTAIDTRRCVCGCPAHAHTHTEMSVPLVARPGSRTSADRIWENYCTCGCSPYVHANGGRTRCTHCIDCPEFTTPHPTYNQAVCGCGCSYFQHDKCPRPTCGRDYDHTGECR